MNLLSKKHRRLVLATLLIGSVAGCENIALMPRPLIEAPNQAKNVTATVDGIDHGVRELYLRAGSSQRYVVSYTTGTRVTGGGRDASINDVRIGDRVRVELREGTGARLFADEIDIEGSGRSAVRTVEGTVERIVPERGFLELRSLNGGLITVYVPEGSSAETRRRFERIRAGDVVRLEGERLDEDRLELLAFR